MGHLERRTPKVVCFIEPGFRLTGKLTCFIGPGFRLTGEITSPSMLPRPIGEDGPRGTTQCHPRLPGYNAFILATTNATTIPLVTMPRKYNAYSAQISLRVWEERKPEILILYKEQMVCKFLEEITTADLNPRSVSSTSITLLYETLYDSRSGEAERDCPQKNERTTPVVRVGVFRSIHHRLSVRVIGNLDNAGLCRLLDPRIHSDRFVNRYVIYPSKSMPLYSRTRPVEAGDSEVCAVWDSRFL